MKKRRYEYGIASAFSGVGVNRIPDSSPSRVAKLPPSEENWIISSLSKLSNTVFLGRLPPNPQVEKEMLTEPSLDFRRLARSKEYEVS
jgi:hypothetical protein